jgi:hypothetical protein
MKKLLAVLAAGTLTASTMGATSCSYIDSYKKSIEQKIADVVATTQLAFHGAFAGKAGIDGNYANNKLKSDKISQYVDSNSGASVSASVNGYMGTNFNVFSAIDGQSNADIKQDQFKGTAFADNPLSGISGIYNTLYSIIGNGISYDLTNTLMGAIGLMNINKDSAGSIDGIFSSLQGIDNSKFEGDFETNNALVETNSDYLDWFYTSLTELLWSLLGGVPEGTDLLTMQEIKDLRAKGLDDKKQDLAANAIMDAVGAPIGALLGGASFSVDIPKLISMIPGVIYPLSMYIDAFKDKTNTALQGKVDLNSDELNHVLDADKTNFAVINDVYAANAWKKYDNVADLNTYDYNGIKDILSSLLLGSKDGEHYSFNRITQILFQVNDRTDQFYLTQSVGQDGEKHDGYIFKGPIKVSPVPGINDGEAVSQYSEKSHGTLQLLFGGVVKGLLDYVAPPDSTISAALGMLFSTHLYNYTSGIGSLLSTILSDDDISGVLYAFDQTIDQANQYLGAVLGMVGGSFDINAIFTPELLSSLKFLSSFAVRPMQELFYGEDLLPGIFNLLGSFGLTLPDEIKDIKNVTDLFNTSFDILGLSLRIADLLPIIVGVLPALLQNWDQIIDLLGEAAAAPKMEDDEKFTVYNANNVKQGGNVDQDDVIIEGTTFKTKLSLGLYLTQNNHAGWHINSSVTGDISISGYADKLLGCDTENKQITKGTFFGDLEALFNGAGGNSLKAAFTSIKTWFDSIDKQTNTQKDNIVAEYLDKKNFTTSDVNYTNLDNESDEPTTVDYVLHYSHDGIVFAYRIYLTLDSSASTKYYKLAKMEEVTV